MHKNGPDMLLGVHPPTADGIIHHLHIQDLATINQRDEFFTSCLTKYSKLLDNTQTDFHFGVELLTYSSACGCYILGYLMIAATTV